MLLADRVRFTAFSLTPAKTVSGVWCRCWLPDGIQLASVNSDWTRLIWAMAAPAGEPGRVTAAVLRASVGHTAADVTDARCRMTTIRCGSR
jgi:hypothetical protein